jgi:predicted dehydrogenase
MAAQDGVEVVAVSEPIEANRQAMKDHLKVKTLAEYDAQDGHLAMIKDMDLTAVGINSPHTLHHEQAMAALKAGVNVFIEKPMVVGIADSVELVEYAEKNDLLLLVGYQRHYEDLYVTGHNVIRDGLIGDVKRFRVFLAQQYDMAGSWRADPKYSGGGQINDSGSHLQDILLWMTGGVPLKARGSVDNLYRGELRDIPPNCDVEMEFDNGAVGSIVIEGDHHPDFTERVTIEGTQGTLKFRTGSLYLTKGTSTELVAPVKPAGYPGGKNENFVACLRGTEENYSTGRSALNTTLMTDMILSLKDRTEVHRDEILSEACLGLDRVV